MSAFDKIIGYESVKEKLQNYADCLANPEKYKKLGVRLPTGILLNGDPGLGKTMMATCLIEESHRKSYIVRKMASDGDFIDEMRKTVVEAAGNAPSVVLFDDIDKFANEDDEHKDAEEYVAIQALIDEYADKGVFFIATANRKESLPDSLLRAGRFDSHISIWYPEEEDSEKIMSYYLGKQKLADDVDQELMARIMAGNSCADLENIINEAGIYAAYKGKKNVDQDSFMYACMKELYCDDAFSSEEFDACDCDDLHETAVHEVGHALISEILEQDSVNLVTILRQDCRAIQGVTNLRHKTKRTRSDFENAILVNLGGKAATEVVCGEVDMGCESDIRGASYSVKNLIERHNEYGFSTGWKRYSEAKWLEENSDKITAFELERYYQLAKRIICKNRGFFDLLVKELEDKKVLTFHDIARIRANVTIVQVN